MFDDYASYSMVAAYDAKEHHHGVVAGIGQRAARLRDVTKALKEAGVDPTKIVRLIPAILKIIASGGALGWAELLAAVFNLFNIDVPESVKNSSEPTAITL